MVPVCAACIEADIELTESRQYTHGQQFAGELGPVNKSGPVRNDRSEAGQPIMQPLNYCFTVLAVVKEADN